MNFRKMQIALFAAGAVLMPSGIIAVCLGWYGAAHAHYAYDQFPYLLSGGLLGVCLTTLGGFLYFGAWQAKAASDQKSAILQLAETMRTLAEVVSRSGADGSGAVPVVVGPEGTTVHRSDCLLVRQRADLQGLIGNETNLVGCRVCSPRLADESRAVTDV